MHKQKWHNAQNDGRKVYQFKTSNQSPFGRCDWGYVRAFFPSSSIFQISTVWQIRFCRESVRKLRSLRTHITPSQSRPWRKETGLIYKLVQLFFLLLLPCFDQFGRVPFFGTSRGLLQLGYFFFAFIYGLLDCYANLPMRCPPTKLRGGFHHRIALSPFAQGPPFWVVALLFLVVVVFLT